MILQRSLIRIVMIRSLIPTTLHIRCFFRKTRDSLSLVDYCVAASTASDVPCKVSQAWRV